MFEDSILDKTTEDEIPVDYIFDNVDTNDFEEIDEPTEEDFVVYQIDLSKTELLNLREEPNQTSKILRVLDKNSHFKLLNKAENSKWMEVVTEDGLSGFVLESFVIPLPTN